jgi:hypothetical protein
VNSGFGNEPWPMVFKMLLTILEETQWLIALPRTTTLLIVLSWFNLVFTFSFPQETRKKKISPHCSSTIVTITFRLRKNARGYNSVVQTRNP